MKPIEELIERTNNSFANHLRLFSTAEQAWEAGVPLEHVGWFLQNADAPMGTIRDALACVYPCKALFLPLYSAYTYTVADTSGFCSSDRDWLYEFEQQAFRQNAAGPYSRTADLAGRVARLHHRHLVAELLLAHAKSAERLSPKVCEQVQPALMRLALDYVGETFSTLRGLQESLPSYKPTFDALHDALAKVPTEL